jgi:hypothetical protein
LDPSTIGFYGLENVPMKIRTQSYDFEIYSYITGVVEG